MKLLYIWVQNYKNKVLSQGIHLTDDFLFNAEYDGEKLTVEYSRNTDQTPKDYFGKHISSAVAIVGQNGSGKSTLCRLLSDVIPSAVQVDRSMKNINILGFLAEDDVDNQDQNYLYVLYDEESCTLFFYHSDGFKVSPFSNDNIKIHLVIENISNASSKNLYRTLYISNVFNPSELLESEHKRDLQEGTQKLQVSITPGYLLKHAAEDVKRDWGYHDFASNEYLMPIYNLASTSNSTPIDEFRIKQGTLFFESFSSIPLDIKKECSIYQKCKLNIRELPPFNKIAPLPKQPNREDQALNNHDDNKGDTLDLFLRFYQIIFQMETSIYYRLFFNLIYEIFYVLIYFGKDNVYNKLLDKVKEYAKELVEKEDKATLPDDIDIIEVIEDCKHSLKILSKQNMSWFQDIEKACDMFLDDSQPLSIYKQVTCNTYIKLAQDASNSELSDIMKSYQYHIANSKFIRRTLEFEFYPVSSGEIAMANLFAYISNGINQLFLNEKHFSDSTTPLILMVDEVDCYMHPRWKQLIIKYLLKYIDSLNCPNIQLVITSHSPIILSDFAKEQIMKIVMEDQKIYIKSQYENTLGADLWRLYYDSFFLHQGDIGEFAKENIQKVTDYLKQPGNTDTDEHKVSWIINHLGQPVYREKFRQQFKKLKTHQEHMENIRQEIISLSKDDRKAISNWLKKVNEDD